MNKRNIRSFKIISFVFVSLMWISTAKASVLYADDFTSIGVSSFIYNSPYIDDDVLNTWSPFIAVQYKNFFIRDVELGYQFLYTYQYGAAISISGDELSQQRKNKKSDNSIKDVKDGLNIKGSFSFYRPSGVYTFTAMQDISDEHNGIESGASWLYNFDYSNVILYPSIYARWMDEKLVDHYFGIKETKLADSYKAKSAWRYGAGITVDYHPALNWFLQTQIANESYSAEVTDSPIVERSNVWLLTLNLGYYF